MTRAKPSTDSQITQNREICGWSRTLTNRFRDRSLIACANGYNHRAFIAIVDKNHSRLVVTSMPGKHGPALADLLLPEVMGSMLQFESPNHTKMLSLYISGDTLVFDELREIPHRYPTIDLGLFHLGGTRIMGILLTMDAEQGVEAVRIINPREAIPIHYNDYELFKSPLADFKRRLRRRGLGHRITYLNHRETYNFEVAADRSQAASSQ